MPTTIADKTANWIASAGQFICGLCAIAALALGNRGCEAVNNNTVAQKEVASAQNRAANAQELAIRSQQTESLLARLADDSARERRHALAVAHYLAKEGKLSAEAIVSVAVAAKYREDKLPLESIEAYERIEAINILAEASSWNDTAATTLGSIKPLVLFKLSPAVARRATTLEFVGRFQEKMGTKETEVRLIPTSQGKKIVCFSSTPENTKGTIKKALSSHPEWKSTTVHCMQWKDIRNLKIEKKR